MRSFENLDASFRESFNAATADGLDGAITREQAKMNFLLLVRYAPILARDPMVARSFIDILGARTMITPTMIYELARADREVMAQRADYQAEQDRLRAELRRMRAKQRRGELDGAAGETIEALTDVTSGVDHGDRTAQLIDLITARVANRLQSQGKLDDGPTHYVQVKVCRRLGVPEPLLDHVWTAHVYYKDTCIVSSIGGYTTPTAALTELEIGMRRDS